MDILLELHCDRCGSAHLSFPSATDDGAAIACNDCGADHGALGAFKAELIAQALEQSAEALRGQLKDLPPPRG